ncbi:MAG: hypothetical protein ABI091_02870 [Ferruginibacter sp.]
MKYLLFFVFLFCVFVFVVTAMRTGIRVMISENFSDKLLIDALDILGDLISAATAICVFVCIGNMDLKFNKHGKENRG